MSGWASHFFITFDRVVTKNPFKVGCEGRGSQDFLTTFSEARSFNEWTGDFCLRNAQLILLLYIIILVRLINMGSFLKPLY